MREFLQDINSELITEARELDVESLGRRMNVVGGPAEMALPKNVGLLFFNEHPEEFFPATQIDVVYFPVFQGLIDQYSYEIYKQVALLAAATAIGVLVNSSKNWI